jgi:oligogalacturonide lyase
VVGRLCRHDASWRRSSHPHPVFTPDGARVIWGSDLGGRMNVYLARAEWEWCALSDC